MQDLGQFLLCSDLFEAHSFYGFREMKTQFEMFRRTIVMDVHISQYLHPI